MDVRPELTYKNLAKTTEPGTSDSSIFGRIRRICAVPEENKSRPDGTRDADPFSFFFWDPEVIGREGIGAYPKSQKI